MQNSGESERTPVKEVEELRTRRAKLKPISREDITECKRVERELRASERLVRTLLNATNDVVHLVDVDGTILDLNDAMASALGATREDLIGTCIFDRFPHEEAERKKRILRHVVREQEPVRFVDEGLGKSYDSSVYPIMTSEEALLCPAA